MVVACAVGMNGPLFSVLNQPGTLCWSVDGVSDREPGRGGRRRREKEVEERKRNAIRIKTYQKSRVSRKVAEGQERGKRRKRCKVRRPLSYCACLGLAVFVNNGMTRQSLTQDPFRNKDE